MWSGDVEIGFEGADWIRLAQASSCQHCSLGLGSMKSWRFIDYLLTSQQRTSSLVKTKNLVSLPSVCIIAGQRCVCLDVSLRPQLATGRIPEPLPLTSHPHNVCYPTANCFSRHLFGAALSINVVYMGFFSPAS